MISVTAIKWEESLPLRYGVDHSKWLIFCIENATICSNMPTPKDILISARLLIKQHGNGAEEYATKKLWAFRQEKDEEGAAIWHSILQGIRALRNMFPPGMLN